MDTYTYSCPGCGAALEYDAPSKKMVCKFCNEYYIPELLGVPDITIPEPEDFESHVDDGETPDYETMDVRIYNCGSCGGEVMTNDVEVSTFCAYCGQPTLMFDRVSKERKPDKVIPFVLTKEQALSLAKEKFEKAQFQEESIQDLKVDSVHGIYMPYWNFQTGMSMKMTTKVRGKYGTQVYENEEQLDKDILLDGSRSFNDDVAFCLNPFELVEAREFSPAYLSGFYADRSDDNMNIKEADAKEKLKDLLKNMILNRTPGVPNAEMRQKYDLGSISAISKMYDYNIDSCESHVYKREYYFLPVYFITFRTMGKKVIILVNGQTGKLIGNIPINEEKLKAKQRINMVIFAVLFAVLGCFLMGFLNVLWGGFLLAILTMVFYLGGITSFKKYQKRYAQTNSENMFRLTRRG